MPGRLRGVGGGFDSGDDPDQAVLPSPLRHDAFQPVDVVEVVDDHQSEAVLDGQLELLVGLGVAVQDQPGGIGARLDGGEDLAAACDVEVQALLDHHPLNRRARERLRREGQIAAGPAAAERVEVLARPVPKGVLGDDDRGGAELGGHLVEPASADHDGAVAVGFRARREQAQQIFGGRLGAHRLSVPRRRAVRCATRR